jgi:hypothetical protein
VKNTGDEEQAFAGFSGGNRIAAIRRMADGAAVQP